MPTENANPLIGRFAAASGLFVTATDTEVGKTIVAGALARRFVRQGRRVGVCKPVATGCRKMRGIGLVSSDTQFLAWSAESDQSLKTITPVTFAEPLAPLVAARRVRTAVDFDAIVENYNRQATRCEVMIVEGIGGLLVPLAERIDVLALAEAMALPLVIVARATLGTINHTLLTVQAARARGLAIAAVAINRYNPNSADVAEYTNPELIGELTGLPVVCVPDDPEISADPPRLSESVLFACSQIPLA